MPLISDISIEATKFHPGAISEETAKLIEHLVYVGNEEPKWWEACRISIFIHLDVADNTS